MGDYVDEKIEQYERKLKQAEKAGKHHKAKKYAEKLERLRAEAAEQSTESDTDSDDDGVDSDDEADNSFALDEEPDVAPRGLKLQLRCVVVIAGDGRAAGILERVHLMQLSVTHLERLAKAAGEHDSVRRLPGTTEGSLRDLELRAAILGYGPDAGDDSPLPLVQPRAVAMRTRSL